MDITNKVLKNFLSYFDFKKGESILFLLSEYAQKPNFFIEKYLNSTSEVQKYKFIEIGKSDSEVKKEIPNFDLIIFLESIDSSLSKQTLKYLSDGLFPNQRFYRIFNFSVELFDNSFNIDKKTIEELNQRIILTGRNSDTIKVQNKFGSDIEIKLDKKFGWIHSFGKFDGKQPGILPPSEVATYSDEINGLLVVDGAINANFNIPLNPIIEDYYITATIEKSVVKELKCDFKILDLLLNKYMKNKNANRIGEVGFGTNIGMTGFVPFISHINERFPSLHLGMGANNQGSLVNWGSPLHLDFILKDCQIYFDDKMILNNGVYLMQNLASLHPLTNVKIGYADTV